MADSLPPHSLNNLRMPRKVDLAKRKRDSLLEQKKRLEGDRVKAQQVRYQGDGGREREGDAKRDGMEGGSFLARFREDSLAYYPVQRYLTLAEGRSGVGERFEM